MKRTSIVWAMLMMLLLTAACARAEIGSGTCGDDLRWVLDDEGTLTISGSGSMKDAQPWYTVSAQIQQVVLEEGVTSVGRSAFYGCRNIASITIPKSVSNFGAYAFRKCSSLTSVTIPPSVTSIADALFMDCSSLTDVTIPESVTSIMGSAFKGCSNLTSISIPEGVMSIGNNVFQGCSSLTSISIPRGVTSIGDNVFQGCSSLMSISIPKGVTSIGDNVFQGCGSLTSISIPEGVTSIGNDVFQGCSSLMSISIPEGVTSIGNNAFYSCSELMSVTIPEGATSIGANAFYFCSSLTSVTIPASIMSIGKNAFLNCDNITDLTVGSVESWMRCSFGNEDSRPNNQYGANIHLYVDGKEITEVSIPAGVTSVGDCAFYGFRSLTSVTIPESVTSIGSEAFYNCTALSSVTIPESVTSIGSKAFYNCTALSSVTIPESMTSISAMMFDGCRNLTSVVIPASVTSIEAFAFYNCKQAEITLPDGITSLDESSLNGVKRIYCNPQTTTTATLYAVNTNLRYCIAGYPDFLLQDVEKQTLLRTYVGEGGDVVIPAGVTYIGDRVFYANTSLTSIVIPENVCVIGILAFGKCSSLTSVTIPNGMMAIGPQAFDQCSKLTSVTIPEGVTDIFDYAFRGCTSMTSVSIPSSVTYIGPYAFVDCSSLTSVTIPEGVTSIEKSTFAGCKQAEITLPDGITSVEADSFTSVKRVYCNPQTETTAALFKAGNRQKYWIMGYPDFPLFDRGTEIVLSAYIGEGGDVVIPLDVTSIADMAFFFAKDNLTRVVVPENVRMIGNLAFAGCEQAEISLPDGISSVASNSFSGVKRIYCTPQTPTTAALYAANTAYRYCMPGNDNFLLFDDGTSVCVGDYTGSADIVLIPPQITHWSTDKHMKDLRLPAALGVDCSFSLTATNVIVPDGVKNLGTLSLTNVQRIYVPDSVEAFDGLSFSGSQPVIFCSEGSAAQDWAMLEGYETCLDGWDSACTLAYRGKIALDVGEIAALDKASFSISPIPVDYRGEITLASSDMSVDGMTITALTPGDAVVTATLDGQCTTSIPVHVYQPVSHIALMAPSICQAGQSFTVSVQALAPEDVSGKLTWMQDGVQVYSGTDTSLTLTAPEGQAATVIRVTAPSGAYSEVTVRVPMTISTPYLRSDVVELGSTLDLCVDVDGETFINDPLSYGDIELGSAASGLALENGVIRAMGIGTMTFRVKSLSGGWAYLTVTVQDTLHAVRTQVAERAPTCAEPGSVAYEICVGCGRFFSAEGEEIEEGSWVLPVTHVHHLGDGNACRDCAQTFDTTGLDVITLPDALSVIMDEAFAGVTAQVIILPQGCETICERAFADCRALQYVFLPAALEGRFPGNAFEGCAEELNIIFR